MTSGTPPAWGRAWWRSTLRMLTAMSSPRTGMPLPRAANSSVRRKPLVRSDWAALRPATTSECAVSSLDNREPYPLIRRLVNIRAALLASRRSGGQERHRPPVPLVGRTVRCPEPVLLVQGAEDHVEGDQPGESGAVRRHASARHEAVREELDGPGPDEHRRAEACAHLWLACTCPSSTS